MRGEAMGAIAPFPPERARKIFLNVSENKSRDRKVIFFILVFTKTFFEITQNAPRPSAGTLPLHTRWMHSPQAPSFPPGRTSGSAKCCVPVCNQSSRPTQSHTVNWVETGKVTVGLSSHLQCTHRPLISVLAEKLRRELFHARAF